MTGQDRQTPLEHLSGGVGVARAGQDHTPVYVAPHIRGVVPQEPVGELKGSRRVPVQGE